MTFPDIELALLDYLGDLGYTVTSTPLDLKDLLPVLRIQRIGGGDDGDDNCDYPIVTIQCYALKTAADPRSAHDLAEIVRDRMTDINLGGIYVGSQNTLMQHCVTVAGPSEMPYLDPAIAIFQGIYRITTKGR